MLSHFFRSFFLLKASQLQENLLSGEKQNRGTGYMDFLNIEKVKSSPDSNFFSQLEALSELT